MYLPFSNLSTLQPSKFDVILIDPPFSSSFTWEHLQELPVPSLAADPSFVFMWVGSGAGQGLERGREVMAKWGYRRCEDVVWVRTNRTSNHGPGTDPPTTSLFTRTKQHCLIGIRGTVRRSSDSWFVHCNVDTDVIMWEGDPDDPTRKPPEMYSLIENFCMGTRRLEIFGKLGSSLRRGWVTAIAGDNVPQTQFSVEGPDGGTASPFEREQWDAGLKALSGGGKCVVPTTQEIDNLRPKSPVRNHSANNNNGGGGASGGVALGNVGPRFGNGGGMGIMGGGMGAGMDMNMMPGMAMAPMGMDPSMMNGGWGGPMMMNPQMMNPQMMDPQHAMMMGGGQGFGMMPMNGMHQMGGGQQGMMNRMAMGMGNQMGGQMGGQMNWGAQDNRMMPGMNMGGQWTGF
ncbi:MT-A70-domain-containing protein [Cylindrobasidium torrendii FP15055 ss-10]|uniref:MT-A70-domain-containing protein n=1 Tax=Cylindrobasidium torrendii FP15055 ss-10 TaxID=1314674 RepID=A0A0D7BRA7_9AGAR|nr:MT-A70-domain-containing protein [Cylindrobasidium torrendii FP15055 ss-10]